METHSCGNVINVLSSFWPPWLDQLNNVSSRDICVNWNEPQVSRLQLYEQPGALNDAGVRAAGCKRSLQRYPKVRSAVATCYTPGRGKIVPRNVM